ncbi:hypothetical protein AV521_00820 [Streptomyces sp. IMTB 2501]|uniref:hypothetical protein n=1 Tax=Streptomyces sp. IMTB 2501 TaxID=1776340 RepID=UPI00096FDFDE|nr:hypothetical protein [Streptomyces sp. IMTB 2501]OLZ74266.1 hypothetical protein AV521_00820 [Streptomyces sp. IMTB 2501]
MSENPFGSSPWDELNVENENTVDNHKESPMTNPTTHTQEGVTLSFKGGEGYDASLLVLRAATVSDMDAMLDEEAGALASLMKRMAKIQSFNSELNFKGKGTKAKPSGKNSFSGGKVQNSGGGEHRGVTDCEHGRTHVAKNGWEAYFCNADERKGEDKCAPAFLDKKSGKFELKN